MKNFIQIIALCCFFISSAQVKISDGGLVRVGEENLSFTDSGGATKNYENNENHQILYNML